MLMAGTALKGYAIEATDGRMGTVEFVDRACQERLHAHYAWPGYGR